MKRLICVILALPLALMTFSTSSCTEDEEYAPYDYTGIVIEDSTLLEEAIDSCATSPNYGKSIAVFGGSHSCNTETEATKYMWKKYLGASVTDYGHGGYGYSSLQGSVQSQVKRAKKHDIFILWCSTNDYTCHREAGTPTDYTEEDDYDTTKLVTQCGGINFCIKFLRDKYPDSRILMFGSLCIFDTEAGYNKNSSITNHTGYNYYHYIQLQEEIARRQNVPFLDQFEIPALRLETVDKYYSTKDKVHLTKAGYANIAPYQLYFLATK